MERTNAYTIQDGTYHAGDPRTATPEIKVYYPEEEAEKETLPPPVTATPLDEPTPAPAETVPAETHVCKVSVQDAISQNWLSFALVGLVLLGLGYAIGKSKTL